MTKATMPLCQKERCFSADFHYNDPYISNDEINQKLKQQLKGAKKMLQLNVEYVLKNPIEIINDFDLYKESFELTIRGEWIDQFVFELLFQLETDETALEQLQAEPFALFLESLLHIRGFYKDFVLEHYQNHVASKSTQLVEN